MDDQDQSKTAPSGHENHGFHLCHRCGWPYPNPHPSAKHRRAHKRICGTIDGYNKHTHLTVSDDEDPSDEDQRTPSPKIEKKSKDEIFSNCVTEFSDCGFSPMIEERSEGIKESDKNVEKTVEGDPNSSQSLKVDTIADTAELLNGPRESSKVYNPEVLESATTILFQDTRTEELAAVPSSINGSPRDLSPIESETLMDAREDNINANVGDNGIQYSMACLGKETDGKGNGDDINDIVTDVGDPPSKIARETSEAESKSQEMDGKTSGPMTADGVRESKQGKSDGSGSGHETSPSEVESVEHMEPPINNVQIKADSAQEIDVARHDDLVEVCDIKREGEGKDDMHVLMVANDLPVVDNPDIMIEDFKDHKAGKSNLPLGYAVGIRSLEDDTDDTVYRESRSGFHSSKLNESIQTSSTDINAVEDNCQHESEDSKLEVPVEGVANTSEYKVSISEDLKSNGLEAPPDTSQSELENTQANESPRDILAECTTIDLFDVIPMATSLDDKVNPEMVKIEKFVTPGNERTGVIEELSTSEKTTLESADRLSVDQTINLPGDDDTGKHEEAKTELPNIAPYESMEGAAAEGTCATNTKTKLESPCQFLESTFLDTVPDSTEVEFDRSDLGNMTQNHSSSQKCQDEDPQEVIKEPKSSCDGEVVAECVGAVSSGSELNHNGDAGVSEKKLEKPILKEPEPSHIDSEFTIKSLGAVVDSHSRDGGKGASGVGSEPKQEEGDNKLPKQYISALYISVDSSSQADSLEGNWGSVSVLSPHSDAPAVIDTETLSSTDSLAHGQSEKANLQKQKTAPEGHRSDKSDVFEHPSFMTLVEDPTTAASDIKTVQNTQQPKSETLQAGWIPSLTNVINESQGRKKNEEVIAKVTNWSTGKQQAPLKSLVGEANIEAKLKSPDPKQTPTVIQKDEIAAKNKGAFTRTVNSVLGSEATTEHAAKGETAKEWNSPARYPTDHKKEKRKVKGKSYWVPFVCCSSVN